MLSYQEKINLFKEWAKTLEVGDEVVIQTDSGWGRCPYSITTITKITPSGRIKTKDGYEFNPDGSVRGSRDFIRLQKVTDEIAEIVNRYHLISYILQKADRKFFEKLPTDDLISFYKSLKKIEEDEKQ